QDVPGGWGQQPQQVQPPPPSGYGYPSNRYPAAVSAELPRAVTWSRRPPPIAPPVQYAPQSRMPAAAAWDPRAAQAPLGYAAPSAGQYVGARYVGGPYAAGQYAAGQYAAGQYAAGQYAAGQYA